MSSPITSGKTWRCALEWVDSASGGIATNVIGIEASEGVTAPDVFAAIDACVTQAMWSWVADTASITHVEVQDPTSAIGSVVFATDGSSKWQGGGLGTSMPQVSGIVKLFTPSGGRSGRGRSFIPFVGEGEYASGTLIDGAAVQLAWAAFQAALEALGPPFFSQAVISKFLGTVDGVISYLAEPKSATQRRRMDRLR